jgi:hypothetical protein
MGLFKKEVLTKLHQRKLSFTKILSPALEIVEFTQSFPGVLFLYVRLIFYNYFIAISQFVINVLCNKSTEDENLNILAFPDLFVFDVDKLVLK